MKGHITAGLIIFLILCFSWFNTGIMLGRAEEGIPFFDIHRTVSMYKNVWQDSGFGSINPFLQPRLTLYYFAMALDQFGFSSQQIQFVVFFLFLLAPFIFMAKLVSLFDVEGSNRIGVIAGLVYVFNLFSQSQIWYRFLLPLISLWSMLPVFLYYLLSWIKFKKFSDLAKFALINVIFSDAFGLFSSVIAVWTPGLILIFHYKAFRRGLAAALVWLCVSFWWIAPFLNVTSNPYTTKLSVTENLQSLVDVSKFFPGSSYVYLKQKYFFENPSISWSAYYQRTEVKLISTLTLILLIAGLLSLIKSRKGKEIISILLISWFLIKGANPPLGLEFFKLLFENIKPLMVLRNPYEKIGAVYLLAYSILVAKGLVMIRPRILRTIALFALTLVLCKPMLNGSIYNGYQVRVPDSYLNMNKLISSASDMRILHFPFLHGAGIEYKWGYKGEEPSEFLFDNPSLSKTYFEDDDPYPHLYNFIRHKEFGRLMQIFGIEFILVHNDVQNSSAHQEGYEASLQLARNILGLQKLSSDENLSAYRLSGQYKPEWAYAPQKIFVVDSFKEGMSRILMANGEEFRQIGFIKNSHVDLLEKYVHRDDFKIAPDGFIHASMTPDDVSVKKLNPYNYQVRISGAKGPYILALANTYNPAWRARIGSDIISKHFIINGYSNGWLVEKEGDYKIDISL